MENTVRQKRKLDSVTACKTLTVQNIMPSVNFHSASSKEQYVSLSVGACVRTIVKNAQHCGGRQVGLCDFKANLLYTGDSSYLRLQSKALFQRGSEVNASI